jgi:hypothetical protein
MKYFLQFKYDVPLEMDIEITDENLSYIASMYNPNIHEVIEYNEDRKLSDDEIKRLFGVFYTINEKIDVEKFVAHLGIENRLQELTTLESWDEDIVIIRELQDKMYIPNINDSDDYKEIVSNEIIESIKETKKQEIKVCPHEENILKPFYINKHSTRYEKELAFTLLDKGLANIEHIKGKSKFSYNNYSDDNKVLKQLFSEILIVKAK